jgi:hypothetical protein
MYIESSLNDLYQSTIKAFPKTAKRQHSTDEIKIVKLEWTPFLGVKTLFLKGLAQNIGNGHEYKTIILFKDVNYNPKRNFVEIVANDGKNHLIERLSYEKHDVLLKCNCKDFDFRFNYYNHLDGSLFGRKRRKYEATTNRLPANPLEMEGKCKHLISMTKALRDSGVII